MLHKPVQLSIAKRNGKWVSIGEVPSGLAGGCICPGCGASLIARKGKRQQHHFAHHGDASCTGAIESALHQFAKLVVRSASALLLPPVVVYRKGMIRPATAIHFDYAKEEVCFNGRLQTDVLGYKKNTPLAVEIKVSHAVDAEKTSAYIREGLACIQIDVRSIYDELCAQGKSGDIEALRQGILHHPHHRSWVFSPLQHKTEYRLAHTATPLPVVTNKKGQHTHYHVYRCPRNLRFVRGGFRDGYSYARVFQDCLHCAACREIVYERVWSGYRQLPTLPIKVLCGYEDGSITNANK
ncbi:MAG: competence protein CoiA family protein [Saprospiraceae bacterium]